MLAVNIFVKNILLLYLPHEDVVTKLKGMPGEIPGSLDILNMCLNPMFSGSLRYSFKKYKYSNKGIINQILHWENPSRLWPLVLMMSLSESVEITNGFGHLFLLPRNIPT